MLTDIKFELFDYQSSFVFDSDTEIVGFVGGMGSAKSTAFVHKCYYMSALHAGKPGLAMSPTFTMTQGNLIPMFREYAEKYNIQVDNLDHSEPKFLDVHWGKKRSRIWLNRSAENHGRMNGLNLAWAGLDEADKCRPEDIVLAVEQMLFRCRNPVGDQTAQVFLTGTPEGQAFLYDYFERDGYDPMKKLYRASTYDNYLLDPKYLARLESQIPKHKHAAYFNGEFVSLTDAGVYRDYDMKLNRTDMNLGKLEPNDELYFSFDLNYGGMSCVFAIHRRATKQIFFVKELMGVLDTEVLLRRVKQELDKWGIPHSRAILTCDPACTQALPIINASGFKTRIMQSHPPIEWNITAMNGKWCNAKDERTMFINPKECPIYAKCVGMQQYRGGEPDKKTKIPEAKTDISGPCDAGRYVVFLLYPFNPTNAKPIVLRGLGSSFK